VADEKATTVHQDVLQISLVYDRATGEVQFNTTGRNSIELLGLLESAKQMVYAMRRKAEEPTPPGQA